MLNEITSLADDEKPHYRRRCNPQFDQYSLEFSHEHAVYHNYINDCKIPRNKRSLYHVAPYNAYLLKRYRCHINVKYVGNNRAVKCLYKYIYKGYDCATIKIFENQRKLMYNEVATYIKSRYITPSEACWRLFGSEIQNKSHSVQRLDIHLRGQYRIVNIDLAQEHLADTAQKG